MASRRESVYLKRVSRFKRGITFNEMSRVQLVQKSHPKASLLGIRDWALPGLTAAQCLGALKVDLGITRKVPQQRIALCRKHLAANPDDVITSVGLCSHFGLNPEEVLSALTPLELPGPVLDALYRDNARRLLNWK